MNRSGDAAGRTARTELAPEDGAESARPSAHLGLHSPPLPHRHCRERATDARDAVLGAERGQAGVGATVAAARGRPPPPRSRGAGGARPAERPAAGLALGRGADAAAPAAVEPRGRPPPSRGRSGGHGGAGLALLAWTPLPGAAGSGSHVRTNGPSPAGRSRGLVIPLPSSFLPTFPRTLLWTRSCSQTSNAFSGLGCRLLQPPTLRGRTWQPSPHTPVPHPAPRPGPSPTSWNSDHQERGQTDNSPTHGQTIRVRKTHNLLQYFTWFLLQNKRQNSFRKLFFATYQVGDRLK